METKLDKVYESEEILLSKARDAIGKSIGQLVGDKLYDKNKGQIGMLIEEKFFGIRNNSRAEADFANLEIELKITPVKILKNKKYSAKERLVLNIINYLEEDLEDFDNSSFWKKNKKILIMFYIYEEDKEFTDYVIQDVILYTYPEEDLKIIKNDWNTITSFIKEGRAHELSENYTDFLSPCTKGANASSMRKQPYSDIPAKQRAYSFKPSYMTVVFNDYVVGDRSNERIIKCSNTPISIESYIETELKKYSDVKFNLICEQFNINSKAKNARASAIAKMLGVSVRLEKTEEFKKANIKTKTILISKRNDGTKYIKEHMSFPKFDFIELSKTKWEDSFMYDIFSNQRFMFCIFEQGDKSDDIVFKGVKFWQMNKQDMNEFERIYNKTMQVIQNGVILESRNGKTYNNFPKKKESYLCHVRPHARDSRDTLPLPDGRIMTKQCFWINNLYIIALILLDE